MKIRTDLLVLGVLAVLAFSACSGGGGGQPSASSRATSPTATRTYELGSAAGSYDLPSLDGFSGSLALPATTVPGKTRLVLTSSLQAPANAPILPDAERRSQATGTLNVYFYTTMTLSYTITFPTLPGFSVTLPATVNPTGLQFFYAISTQKPTNGAEAQFRTEGPATVSGQIVTFSPSSTPLALQAGQSYTIAFYAISTIVAKPTATPRAPGKIYVANFGTAENFHDGSVTTYTANGAPTVPTITGLSLPWGLAIDAAGKIYVVSEGDNAIRTYDANGTPTTPTITALNSPRDVAVDEAGKIYVVSGASNALMTFDANGARSTPTITGLDGVWGVAVDAAGKIYLTNDGNNTLTTYTANGTPTAPTITGLDFPTGVAVDAAGKIYVANAFGNTVTTYTAAGVQTTPTITGLNDPLGVAVDAAGKIYVTSSGNNTVTTYNANGTTSGPTIATGVSPVGIVVR